MSLINIMREKRVDPHVTFTDFLHTYSKKGKNLYCFFEAKDDEVYYFPIIQQNTKKNYTLETFTCNNKDGVLKVYQLIKDNKVYTKAKSGFFIDRDFDPVNKNPEIFVTPFYSIENFYVRLDTVKHILYQQFRIPRKSDDFKNCKKLYKKLQTKFHEKVINVNSWLACYADVRNQRGSKINQLNIDDKIKFSNSVASDLSEVKVEELDYDDLMSLFHCPTDLISKKKFKRKKRQFASCKKSEVFRGKFELQFFVCFLSKFKAIIEDRNQNLCSTRYKTPLQFKIENVFTQLNSYAYVPNSLRKYIKRIAA